MTIVGQVEIDPWCRKVLAKHWPEVPRHDDVRTAARWWLIWWPTPMATGKRKSRKAIGAYSTSPTVEQAVELASGILPRELDRIEAAPESWRRLWPLPIAETSSQDDTELTLFAADSLASPSASRGRASRRPTSGGYGQHSRTSFARYDPATSSWKTSQVSLDGEWETYSETWPARV